jgi:putative SOS response-associated peptidase YedK
MCGRPREAIAKEFGVPRFAEVDRHPRYKVAPSQIVETIISVNGEKRLGPMRWGFVSPTAKEAEARAHQRTGGHVAHLTYVSRRLPTVSLPPGGRRLERWLDSTMSEAELRGLLVPLPADGLEAREVFTLVNSPRNDSPECVRPVRVGE